MALDLALDRDGGSPAGEPAVAIDEELLWQLPGRLGVDAPAWTRLGEACWDDPVVDAGEVGRLAAEVRTLRDRWVASQREEAARTHRVTAQDPAVRARILDQLLAHRPDPITATLDALIALCDRALAAGLGLAGLSD